MRLNVPYHQLFLQSFVFFDDQCSSVLPHLFFVRRAALVVVQLVKLRVFPSLNSQRRTPFGVAKSAAVCSSSSKRSACRSTGWHRQLLRLASLARRISGERHLSIEFLPRHMHLSIRPRQSTVWPTAGVFARTPFCVPVCTPGFGRSVSSTKGSAWTYRR